MIRSGFQRRYCRAREVKLLGCRYRCWSVMLMAMVRYRGRRTHGAGGGSAGYHTDEVWATKRACKVGRETIRDSARAPVKRDRASSISLDLLAGSQLSSLMRKELAMIVCECFQVVVIAGLAEEV